MKRTFDLRFLAVPVLLALGLACAFHAAVPRTYVASARVLVAASGPDSRIVKLQSSALDPVQAQSQLSAQLASQLAHHAGASLLDAPATVPGARSLGFDLAAGGALGLVFGVAFTLWRERRRRPVRIERDLVPVLGDPLLAARPLQHEALRALARQLLEHWFSAERKLLPVVSAGRGDGRTSVALELAHLFAEMGQRTLLVDANFRAPSLHRACRLPNRAGLADLLDDRPVQLAARRENLAVLVAGRVREDPLELLSRPRLVNFLQAAARPFAIVLIDTPAAESGPDLEIFAALARGALLVVRPGEDAARLAQLRRRLARCRARPVVALFNHNSSVFSRR